MIPTNRKMTPAQAFAVLEAAAAKGERCPTSADGMASNLTSALAHAGKIAVEISTHNWRRVTILVGPHKGKSTAPNPLKKCSTYLTIDKRGTLRNGRLVVYYTSKRQQPSKPQLLAPFRE